MGWTKRKDGIDRSPWSAVCGRVAERRGDSDLGWVESGGPGSLYPATSLSASRAAAVQPFIGLMQRPGPVPLRDLPVFTASRIIQASWQLWSLAPGIVAAMAHRAAAPLQVRS